jgi:hypothetical protein
LGAPGSPAETAAAVEFVLEGLHLSRRLNRERVGGSFAYRRMSPKDADEPGGRGRRERDWRREEGRR